MAQIPDHLKCFEWYPAHLKAIGYRVDVQPKLADLRGADLRDAGLRGANLRGADLRDADLRGANLRGANLRGANLRDADLSGADLRGANLSDADLRDAGLRGANLRDADLSGADLRGADLRGADIENAQWNYTTVGIHAAPEGELIGWGKKSNEIVKMLIPRDARRSCATTRKFRAERIITLEIEGGLNRIEHSTEYGTVVYEVGKETLPDKFDDNRWNECSNGIHFFLTREEAERW